MKLKIVIAIFFILISSQSFAKSATGNDILDICAKANNSGLCIGYFSGYVQGIISGSFLDLPKNFVMSPQTARNILFEHLNRVPVDGGTTAGTIIALELVKNNKARIRQNIEGY